MNPLDWCPWYLSKWQGESVRLLSLAAQGAYMQILLLQFREGSVPSDVKKLAKLIGQDSTDLAAVWPEISEQFVEGNPGRLVNVTMAEIRFAQITKHEAATSKASTAAKARWEAAQLRAQRESEIEARQQVEQDASNAAVMLQASHENAPSITGAMLQASGGDAPSNADAMPLEKIREEENREEKKEPKIEGAGGKIEAPAAAKPIPWERALVDLLPETHQTTGLKTALTKYGQLRRQKGWGVWADVTVKATATKWAMAPVEAVIAALEKSVESGWQSVNVDKSALAPSVSLDDDKAAIVKMMGEAA